MLTEYPELAKLLASFKTLVGLVEDLTNKTFFIDSPVKIEAGMQKWSRKLHHLYNTFQYMRNVSEITFHLTPPETSLIIPFQKPSVYETCSKAKTNGTDSRYNSFLWFINKRRSKIIKMIR